MTIKDTRQMWKLRDDTSRNNQDESVIIAIPWKLSDQTIIACNVRSIKRCAVFFSSNDERSMLYDRTNALYD